MNLLIVGEDEKMRIDLIRLLEELCPIAVPVAVTSRQEVKSCLLDRPHGVLLDMDRSWDCGISLIQEAAQIGLPVIVITGDESFAVKAYDLGVVDCLIKPLDVDRFDLALSRVRSGSGDEAPREFIVLSDSLNAWPVKLSDVIMIEGDGGYSTVHLSGKPTITISKSLKEIEAEIPGGNFIRANRNMILNLAYIRVFRRLSMGRLRAEILGRDPVEFSRRQAQDFRKRFLL